MVKRERGRRTLEEENVAFEGRSQTWVCSGVPLVWLSLSLSVSSWEDFLPPWRWGVSRLCGVVGITS